MLEFLKQPEHKKTSVIFEETESTWQDQLKNTRNRIIDYIKNSQIYERLDSFKNNTKLVYSLSALMTVVGILLLGWYLTPRLDSYITSTPKAYRTQSLRPNIRYVFTKSDIITGTTSPNGYVKIILKEPKIVLRARADSKGTWLLRIPNKIPEKNYQMQILSFDKNGNNPSVRLVKTQIQSNNIVYQSKIYKDLAKLSKQIFNKT